MRVAISFLCTQFHILQDHWMKNAKSKTHTGTDAGLGGLVPNQRGIEPFIGGKVIILDWPEMNIIWEMDLDGAAGFVIEGETLTVCNMRLNYILQVNMKSKIEVNIIRHSAFNCLHSLNKTQSGYLVSSTGTDLIIEVDKSGRCLFNGGLVSRGMIGCQAVT